MICMKGESCRLICSDSVLVCTLPTDNLMSVCLHITSGNVPYYEEGRGKGKKKRAKQFRRVNRTRLLTILKRVRGPGFGERAELWQFFCAK